MLYPKILMLVLSYALLLSFCFAEEIDTQAIEGPTPQGEASQMVDIAITDILLPKRIYLNQRATIGIMLANNSDIDLAGCTLNITAEDGSNVNQQLLLEKKASGKVELQWVPQREGEIKLEVIFLPPQGMQDTDIKNNQLTKTIQVCAK